MHFKEIPPAQNTQEVQARHEGNRQAWNEAAQEYAADNEQRVQNLQAGKSNLHPIERRNLARLGPFKDWCQRAIHLQCASGYDTMSLVLEGVHEVVGVDISDGHIENARLTSERLAMPATWYRCDVLATPVELNGTADLVYTGRGAINWLHDLGSWASVVQRLLKTDGILHLLEDHPASWLFDQDSETLVASNLDYFNHVESNQGWPSSYLGDEGSSLGPAGTPVTEQSTKYECLWTIANVVQALINAGLTIEYLGEHPEPYWDAFPQLRSDLKAKIPMTYSLMAQKTA
ncbi:MAG: class I SAM-dependent methyltransferase [Chloroflexota bacterium]